MGLQVRFIQLSTPSRDHLPSAVELGVSASRTILGVARAICCPGRSAYSIRDIPVLLPISGCMSTRGRSAPRKKTRRAQTNDVQLLRQTDAIHKARWHEAWATLPQKGVRSRATENFFGSDSGKAGKRLENARPTNPDVGTDYSRSMKMDARGFLASTGELHNLARDQVKDKRATQYSAPVSGVRVLLTTAGESWGPPPS